MSRRTSRVNDLLREELSELVLRSVKDPRIGHGLLSITEVEVSADLANATVFVSHLGSDEERRESLEGLTHAVPFLERELRHRLRMKRTPHLAFRFDPSIARGARIAEALNEIAREREHDDA